MTSALDLNPRNQPRRRSQQQKRPPLRERSSSEANELLSSTPKRHTRQSGSYDGHAKPYGTSGRTSVFAPAYSHEYATISETTTKAMVTNRVDYGYTHHDPPVRVPNLTRPKGGQPKPSRINTRGDASSISSPKYGARQYADASSVTNTPTATWFSPTTATPPTSPPKSAISAKFPFPAVPFQGAPPIPPRRQSLYTNVESSSPDAQTVPVVLSSSPPPRQQPGGSTSKSTTVEASAATKQVNRRSSGARYTAFPPPLKSPKRQSFVGSRDPNRLSGSSIGPGHTPIDFSASNTPWPMLNGFTGQPEPVSTASSKAREAPKDASSGHLSIQRHPLRQSPTNLAWAGPYTSGVGEPPLPEPSTAHQSRQAYSVNLSTIPSESERTSRSMTEVSSMAGPHVTRGTYTLQSHASSGVLPTGLYNSGTPLVPAPLFSPPKTRDSDEKQDKVTALRSPTLKPPRPPNPYRLSAESNVSGRSSYLGGALPTWVQLYYSRGERASMIDYAARESPIRETPSPKRGPPSPPRAAPSPGSSSGPSESPESDTIPIVLTRPRNRPYEDVDSPSHQAGYEVGAALTADTPVRSAAMAASAPYHDDAAFLHPRSTPRPAMQIRSPSASPYLHQDQRGAARISAWQVPSLDEPVHDRFFSRCNRQIILFCLGFLLPPLWMVGAVLPLPYRPEIRNIGTPTELKLEQEMYNKLGPVDERRYAKAKWWRTLNSIMSAVGLVITGIMIGLAIIGTRSA